MVALVNFGMLLELKVYSAFPPLVDALTIGCSAPVPKLILMLAAGSTRSECAVAEAVPDCLETQVRLSMTLVSKCVAARSVVTTTVSLALELEGVCVMMTWNSRETEVPTGTTGGEILINAAVVLERARAGPAIWDQLKASSDVGIPAFSWVAERVTNTPLRTVRSVPADAMRATGGESVGLAVLDEVEVVVGGGGQFAI
jgi:hypothetical protein